MFYAPKWPVAVYVCMALLLCRGFSAEVLWRNSDVSGNGAGFSGRFLFIFSV